MAWHALAPSGPQPISRYPGCLGGRAPSPCLGAGERHDARRLQGGPPPREQGISEGEAVVAMAILTAKARQFIEWGVTEIADHEQRKAWFAWTQANPDIRMPGETWQ